MKNIIFQDNLIELRSICGDTIEVIANRIGVSKRGLLAYESGKIKPTIEKLVELADIYGASIDFLIHGRNTEYIKHISFLHLIKKREMNPEGKSIITYLLKEYTRSFMECSKNENEKKYLTNDIHNNLKLIREYSKQTRKQIADILGCAEPSIHAYERDTMPSYEALQKYSQLAGLSMHFIITGKNLCVSFKDKELERLALIADHNLPLTSIKIITDLINDLAKISTRV
ncbi:MAG: helix-turn-helix transcriptional regulator [Spirochaetes bacterium]|nr:helix-turn-helix transcriptional regulator [Spirochaetota bacterium]